MPRWAIVTTALAAVAAILSWELAILRPVWIVLTLLAGACFLSVLFGLLWLRLRPKDPYSLANLRQVHERAGWAEAEEIEVDPDADIVCPTCGTVRGAIFPICPHCKSRCS